MGKYDNKTILITGATGLIGSNLVHTLMNSSPKVKLTILARNEEKVRISFKEYLNHDNFKFIIQDIIKPIETDEKYDYVFHAAGSISGDVIRNYPVDIIEANIQGTINCLELLKKQGTGRLVIFSSATVYGNCENERTVKEEDTTMTDALDSSISAYSQSKRMVETLARAYYSQYNVDTVIARFSYVFGYTKYYPNTAIFSFIQKALAGEDIVLNGINFARRDNIYVEDAVKILLEIAEKGISAEAYNISSNGEGKNYAAIDEIAEEIVCCVNKLKNSTVKLIKKDFNNLDRLPGMLMDNTKTRQVTGFAGGHNLNEAISRTVASYYNDLKEMKGSSKTRKEIKC